MVSTRHDGNSFFTNEEQHPEHNDILYQHLRTKPWHILFQNRSKNRYFITYLMIDFVKPHLCLIYETK